MDTEELVGEATEILGRGNTEKALQAWRHLAPTQAMTWSQSVLNQLRILMTLLTVPMRMKSFWFYFQSNVHLFLTLNQSWTLVWVRCLDSIQIAPALHYQPSHWNAI
jgi:hypothetical protein